MADDPGRKSITLSIYGVGGPGLPAHFVDADVFNRKLRAFITALKRADKRIKGARPAHTFYISHLQTGSAEVGITELAPPQMTAGSFSLDTVLEVVEEVNRGDFVKASVHAELATALHEFAKGASRTYSHIEVRRDEKNAVRIDSFFERQAQQFVEATRQLDVDLVPEMAGPLPDFKGTTHDAFDGTLKEIDFRGTTWRAKLVLTGSEVEVTCVIRGPRLEEVQKALNVRVWAEGLAIYNGKSGLPQRLEVHRLRPINMTGDLRRWRGKVSPDETGGDEESDRLDQ